MAFGPKARTLLTGGTDGATRLWTVPDMEPLHVMKGHERTLYASAFHPSGTHAASADSTGRLRVWDVENGHAIRTIETGGRLNGLAFSPDGELLYGGGTNGLSVWETKTGARRDLPPGLAGHVSDFALHRDGASLAVASGSISAHVWNTRTWTLVHTFKASGAQLGAIALHPTRPLVAVGSGEGRIRVWNLRSEKLVQTVEAHPATTVFSVVFDPTGRVLASGGGDHRIQLFDVRAPRNPSAPEAETDRRPTHR